MVHVTNRAHVHVRLGPLEFAFAISNSENQNAAQDCLRSPRIAGPLGSPAPRPKTVVALLAARGDDRVGDVLGASL